MHSNLINTEWNAVTVMLYKGIYNGIKRDSSNQIKDLLDSLKFAQWPGDNTWSRLLYDD